MTAPRPRVLTPVAFGDPVVWVSGVTPGATVTVQSGGQVLGVRQGADPLMSVPVTPVSAPVHVRARSGGRTRTSAVVVPVPDPGGAGAHPGVARRDVDYGRFGVPVDPTPSGSDGGFDVDLRGQVHLPAQAGGAVASAGRPWPLVVIAHGYWLFPEEDPTSLQGYRWLADHLARWGVAACSVDLSQVNRQTGPDLQQWARGEVVLAMVDRLTADPQLAGLLDRSRVGLVGHSMAGEGVVVAQLLNRRRRTPYGVRGVVSLAPTNYRPELASTGAAYLQLHGSLDYLLDLPGDVTGRQPRFGGFRLYDRAWRHRTLAFVEGARHEGWNSVWRASPNSLEPPPDPLLPDLPTGRQQDIGRALVTAFFLDTLLGRREYRGHLAGPPRPQGLRGIRVHVQHQSPSAEVVDDFGDAQDQFGLGAEAPADRTVNRRGQPVQAGGAGLDRWEEVPHVTLPRSVHDTRGVDLAWLGSDATYETGLGSLAATDTDVLSIRVAQHYAETAADTPDETWNPVGQDADLVVELDDGTRQAAVRLGPAGAVPYPLAGVEPYSVFSSVRIPLDAFTAVNPDLDLGALRQLRLRPARPTGRILVDDIEVETALVTAPARVTMLRAHEIGTGFGPPGDHIDAEVVVQLDGRPGESFGFQLRTDARLPAALGMFAALRAALAADAPVRIQYLPCGPSVRDVVGVHRAGP